MKKRFSYNMFAIFIFLAAVTIVFAMGVTRAKGLFPGGKGLAMKAIEFPSDTRWLNTKEPVLMSSLKGRVVVMDFWTYCCINCLHTLPRLAELEKTFADKPVTVLGIHSGKFDQEKDDQKVAEAIAKYDIHHPVAMDEDYEIWRSWSVRAWPTVIVIDSTGQAVFAMSGEPEPGQLEAIVEDLLRKGEETGTLKPGPGPEIVTLPDPGTPLRFPGKVLVKDDQLFIADTAHHRILVGDTSGKITKVFGGTDYGLFDGKANQAKFHSPQGMALLDNILYVADQGNHAIREINLKSNTVKTIAGTGKKARGYGAGGEAVKTSLRSPWALSWRDNGLDIAMAGSHQLWRLDFASGRVEVLAGTGSESIEDGSLKRSTFAQPSGLSYDEKTNRLYIADSETSAVRVVDFTKKSVRTLIGTGLFDFGKKDGLGAFAQLQHPLGITVKDSDIYIADTFNNTLRKLEINEGNRVTTPSIQHVVTLNEPSGLSIDGDTLYIADTNNHRILAVSLKTMEGKVIDIVLP